MAHVVMGPIVVEDPPLLLQPLSERSARKGGENGKSGKFDIVSLDEFNRSPKDSRIIPIKTEDERTVNADPVILNGFESNRTIPLCPQIVSKHHPDSPE